MIEVRMLDQAGAYWSDFEVELPSGDWRTFDHKRSMSRLMEVPHTGNVVRVTVGIEHIGELA